MTASRIRAARSRRRGKGKVGNDFLKENFIFFVEMVATDA